MTDESHPEHRRPATRWESASTTSWGQVLTEVETGVLLRALSLAGPPGDAIEVGCEGGRWSELAAGAGWSMTCTDIDAAILAACRERVPSATTVLVPVDDDRLPMIDGAAQLAMCIECPASLAPWFPTEAARVVRPGGILIASTWNRRSWRGLVARRPARRNDPIQFYSKSYRTFRDELEAAGFTLDTEIGYAWAPVRRESDSRSVTLWAWLERRLGLRRLPSWSPWAIVIARRN